MTDVPQDRIRAWQEQAEYLLDEGDAGAASSHAADHDPLREQWTERAKPGANPQTYSDIPSPAQLTATPVQPPQQPNTPINHVDRMGLLHSEINNLLDVDPARIQVFPNPELPTINPDRQSVNGGVAPFSSDTLANQLPQRASQSALLGSSQPSRFLRQPIHSLPDPTQNSILARPAPAIGKVPAPAVPPVSLTAEQIRFLDDEIGRLYSEVNRVLAARREITGHALSLLSEAREIILSEPYRLGRAEYNLNQVRSILERAEDSRRQSSRRGFRVLLYLALWLAATAMAGVSLSLYSADLNRIATVLFGSESRIVAHLSPFLWAMITGSAGAVVGAIVGFLTHVRSGQDFDRQHVVRFAIQPTMGIVLGVLLYLLFSFLFTSMQIDLTERALTRALPVVLALPAGLWQEWIYASLYRLFGFFTLRPRRR